LGHRAKSPILIGIFVVSLLVLVSLVPQAEAGVIIGQQYYDYDCPMCSMTFSLPGGGLAMYDHLGNMVGTPYLSKAYDYTYEYTTPEKIERPPSTSYIPTFIPTPNPVGKFIDCYPELYDIDKLFNPSDVNALFIEAVVGHYTGYTRSIGLNSYYQMESACRITITPEWKGVQLSYSEVKFPSEGLAKVYFEESVNYIHESTEHLSGEDWQYEQIYTDDIIGSDSFMLSQTSATSRTIRHIIFFQVGPYAINMFTGLDNKVCEETDCFQWDTFVSKEQLIEMAKLAKKQGEQKDTLFMSQAGLQANVEIPKCNNALISSDEFKSITGNNNYDVKTGDYRELAKSNAIEDLESLLELEELCLMVAEQGSGSASDQVTIWQVKWDSDEEAIKNYETMLNDAKSDSQLSVAVGRLTANSYDYDEEDQTNTVLQKGSYTLVATYTSVPGTIEKLSDLDFKEIVETAYDKIPGSISSPQPTPAPQPSPSPQPTPPQPSPSLTPSPQPSTSGGIFQSNFRATDNQDNTIFSVAPGNSAIIKIDLENRGTVTQEYITFF